MFAIDKEIFPTKVQTLQELALPIVVEKALRDASKLSLRLGIDIYFYNTSGNRAIKGYSYIDFIDGLVNFIIMKDDRIAVENAPYLSAIWTESWANKYFKFFVNNMIPIHKDRSGIRYYETKLPPYHVIKANMTEFGDMKQWSDDKWMEYFKLWEKCPPLRQKRSQAFIFPEASELS